MSKQDAKQVKRCKRHKRVRSRIHGTAKRPRFSVFKSNKYIYAQLINDDKGQTLVCINTKDIKSNKKLNKTELAYKAGVLLAEKAIKKTIKEVIFDRGGYKFHGRIKAIAEGAREKGLEF